MPENSELFELQTDNTLLARLIGLRDAVEPILANNLQPDFTDHSRHHSDHIAKLINEMARHLQSNPHRLSPREIFILYAACYLHDIGMQYEAAGNTNMRIPAQSAH